MEPIKPPDGGWGWAVVAAAFFVFFFMDGIANSFGVLATELVVELQLSRQLSGWIAAIMVALTLVTGPVASIASRKFGNRPVVIAGAVISSIGYAASSLVTEAWMLLFTFGGMVGFGVGLMYLPTVVTLGVYFERLHSSAVGIAVCGSGIGTLVFSPLTSYFIHVYSWRGSFLLMSGIILNCAAMGAVFRPLQQPTKTHRPPPPLTTTPQEEALILKSASDSEQQQQMSSTQEGSSILQLLRKPYFLAFLASNLLTSLGFNPPFLFMPDRARRSGVSRTAGSFLVSIIGVTSTAGRIFFGLVSDRSRVNRLLLYGATLIVAGSSQAFSFLSDAYGFMVFYCAVFGFFTSTYVTMMSPVLLDLVGLGRHSESLGMTMFVQGVGALIGLPLTGFLYDVTQSFNLSFIASGSLVIVSGILLCLTVPCAPPRASQRDARDSEVGGVVA